MPEPNATPAPLTMTDIQERIDRVQAGCAYQSMARCALVRAFAELDATRAKLAEAEAQRGADQRASVVSANAKHEMWQEAIDQRDRNADLVDALNVALAAAESRVAALTEALRECEEWFDGRADVDDGPDGQPVPNSAMRMQQLCAAALSPSQDAKEARDA